MPYLPVPRGPLTEELLAHLRRRPHDVGQRLTSDVEVASFDEGQLALHVLYGLHYDGFAEVDDAWEWEPSLLRLRGRLEHLTLSRFDRRAHAAGSAGLPVADALLEIIGRGSGRSLSDFVAGAATLEQLRELLVHRSVYQRKEADAHTFALPRLRGVAKAAMVRIQADEYGGGVPGRSHAELFATTMAAVDLDPTPGTYVDLIPGVTLATDNLVSLFSLHRARRAELIGHLALFEMTSVTPMSRYAAGIRRLTGCDAAAEFYDVHVVADEVHAMWAAHELAAGFVADNPDRRDAVLFGAEALMQVEASFSDHLLDRWAAGRSSLRSPALEHAEPLVIVDRSAA